MKKYIVYYEITAYAEKEIEAKDFDDADNIAMGISEDIYYEFDHSSRDYFIEEVEIEEESN